jgi:hypothetical protein
MVRHESWLMEKLRDISPASKWSEKFAGNPIMERCVKVKINPFRSRFFDYFDHDGLTEPR